MAFRRNQKVIVEIETFGEIVSVEKDTVVVTIGKMNYQVKKGKVRHIIPEQVVDVVGKRK